jgi:hypothetical protein
MPAYKFAVEGLSKVEIPEDEYVSDHREYIEQKFIEAADAYSLYPSKTSLDGDVVEMTFVNDMAGDALRDLDRAVREAMSTRGELLQEFMDDAVSEIDGGESLAATRIK